LEKTEYYLPLEKFSRKYFFLSKYINLLYWFLGLLVLCFGLIYLFEKRPFKDLINDYLILVLIGMGAIHLNALFMLYLSNRIRNLLPYIDQITNEDARMVYELYRKIVFKRQTIYLFTLLSIILGYLTFAWLGLNLPSRTIVIAYIGVFFVFGLLGMTIGFIINIWRFFLRIDILKVIVQPTHPDYMGGLKPFGDLNSTILYFGAMLGAIYTLGANFMPYKRPSISHYANIWVVLAIVLYIIALLLPTFKIHALLLGKKREYQQRINVIKRRFLSGLEKYCEGTISLDNNLNTVVSTVKYLQEEVNKMEIWPYRNIWKTILSLATIQAIASMLANFDRISRFIKGIL